MPLPIISSVSGAALLLLQMVLMFRVAAYRGTAKQPIGDGGNNELLRRIRRHGNLAENAGAFIVCFALAEVLGANRVALVSLTSVFVLVRILHAIGLTRENTQNGFRAVGAEIVILAVPYGAAPDALAEARDLNGKTLVDITNPITSDYMALTIGTPRRQPKRLPSLFRERTS